MEEASTYLPVVFTYSEASSEKIYVSTGSSVLFFSGSYKWSSSWFAESILTLFFLSVFIEASSFISSTTTDAYVSSFSFKFDSDSSMVTSLLKNSSAPTGFIFECPNQWHVVSLSLYKTCGDRYKKQFLHITTSGKNPLKLIPVDFESPLIPSFVCYFKIFFHVISLFFSSLISLGLLIGEGFGCILLVYHSTHIYLNSSCIFFVTILFGFSNGNGDLLKQLNHLFTIYFVLQRI